MKVGGQKYGSGKNVDLCKAALFNTTQLGIGRMNAFCFCVMSLKTPGSSFPVA
jgi:hypothetical protein